MSDPEMSEPSLSTTQIITCDCPLIKSPDSMEKHNLRASIGGLTALERLGQYPDRTKECVHLREKIGGRMPEEDNCTTNCLGGQNMLFAE